MLCDQILKIRENTYGRQKKSKTDDRQTKEEPRQLHFFFLVRSHTNQVTPLKAEKQTIFKKLHRTLYQVELSLKSKMKVSFLGKQKLRKQIICGVLQ